MSAQYLMHRRIFVTTKEVGLSRAFHEENEISYLFNLISKSSNHSHFTDMTAKMMQWWLDNMKHVALQLIDTPGNVVLCCNHGRTRSPMYLVTYIIIVYGVATLNAIDIVHTLLIDQRGQSIDRHDHLVPIVENIYKNT